MAKNLYYNGELVTDIVLSEKDKCHQTFEQYKNNPDF